MGSIPGPTRTLWALVGAVILAAVLSSSARAQPIAWSDPVPIDNHPPFSNANGLNDVSCPTESLCVAASDGRLLVSTRPTGGPSAWRAVRLNGSLEGLGLGSVSCPSEHFCVATGGRSVIWSSRPTAGPSS
jgi:hypothetical protein